MRRLNHTALEAVSYTHLDVYKRQAPLKIKEGLNRYLDDQGIASVTELAGMVKPW